LRFSIAKLLNVQPLFSIKLTNTPHKKVKDLIPINVQPEVIPVTNIKIFNNPKSTNVLSTPTTLKRINSKCKK